MSADAGHGRASRDDRDDRDDREDRDRRDEAAGDPRFAASFRQRVRPTVPPVMTSVRRRLPAASGSTTWLIESTDPPHRRTWHGQSVVIGATTMTLVDTPQASRERTAWRFEHQVPLRAIASVESIRYVIGKILELGLVDASVIQLKLWPNDMTTVEHLLRR